MRIMLLQGPDGRIAQAVAFGALPEGAAQELAELSAAIAKDVAQTLAFSDTYDVEIVRFGVTA